MIERRLLPPGSRRHFQTAVCGSVYLLTGSISQTPHEYITHWPSSAEGALFIVSLGYVHFIMCCNPTEGIAEEVSGVLFDYQGTRMNTPDCSNVYFNEVWRNQSA